MVQEYSAHGWRDDDDPPFRRNLGGPLLISPLPVSSSAPLFLLHASHVLHSFASRCLSVFSSPSIISMVAFLNCLSFIPLSHSSFRCPSLYPVLIYPFFLFYLPCHPLCQVDSYSPRRISNGTWPFGYQLTYIFYKRVISLREATRKMIEDYICSQRYIMYIHIISVKMLFYIINFVEVIARMVI